jgi:hypothetical protein
MMKTFLFLCLCFLTGFSWAQDFVINNVKVFDGESVLENASVEVKAGKIFKVSKEALVKPSLMEKEKPCCQHSPIVTCMLGHP